jgi:hypothetical protein
MNTTWIIIGIVLIILILSILAWLKLFLIGGILLVIAIILGLNYNKINNLFNTQFFEKTASPEQQLIETFKIYDCMFQNSPLIWKRVGKTNDGGYVVPMCALEKCDILLGYGISDDISFEQDFIKYTGKTAIGFDCTTKLESPQQKLTIVKECVVSNPEQSSLQPASTFSDHIQRYQLENKKIFIKMDIEGGEYEVYRDLLKYASQITGIVLEVHIEEKNKKNIPDLVRLIKAFEKDFYLVHLHMNNYSKVMDLDFPVFKGGLSHAFELTFIHKNMVSDAKLKNEFKGPTPLDQTNIPNGNDIEFVVYAKKTN